MAVTLTIVAADDITAYTATLNAYLDDLDGNPSLDVYFEWGLTTSYGTSTTPQTLSTDGSAGFFDAAISGLVSHTTYHFRAVATDGVDFWYSSDTTLFTLYTFKPDTPLNLQGDPGPFTILWSWEEPFFIWPQITVTVSVDGVPYTYPKGIGIRYAPVVMTPALSVVAETPVTEDGLSLSVPSVPSTSIICDVFELLGEVSLSVADPCVATYEESSPHGLVDDDVIKFATTGTLPTGLVVGTYYYVAYIDDYSFNIRAGVGGTNIVTTGTQSGTHALWYKTN